MSEKLNFNSLKCNYIHTYRLLMANMVVSTVVDLSIFIELNYSSFVYLSYQGLHTGNPWAILADR